VASNIELGKCKKCLFDIYRIS